MKAESFMNALEEISDHGLSTSEKAQWLEGVHNIKTMVGSVPKDKIFALFKVHNEAHSISIPDIAIHRILYGDKAKKEYRKRTYRTKEKPQKDLRVFSNKLARTIGTTLKSEDAPLELRTAPTGKEFLHRPKQKGNKSYGQKEKIKELRQAILDGILGKDCEDYGEVVDFFSSLRDENPKLYVDVIKHLVGKSEDFLQDQKISQQAPIVIVAPQGSEISTLTPGIGQKQPLTLEQAK